MTASTDTCNPRGAPVIVYIVGGLSGVAIAGLLLLDAFRDDMPAHPTTEEK